MVVKRIVPPWKVDPKLIEQLRAVALKEKRSQVGQVELILEKWLDDYEAASK